MKNNTKHSANFLASSFLSSKRSLKKIYALDPIKIAVLRYVCDSIDRNYSSKKNFQTKIYYSQIAKYCHCSIESVKRAMPHLFKKRLIRYVDNCTYTVCKILYIGVSQTPGIDRCLTDTTLRSVSVRHLSNSSNSSNTNFKEFEKRAPTASALLEEFMAKNKLISQK